MVTTTESQLDCAIKLSITIPVSIGLQLAVNMVSLKEANKVVIVVVILSQPNVVVSELTITPVSIGLQLDVKIVSL